MIPDYMKVNRSQYAPREELVRSVFTKSLPLFRKDDIIDCTSCRIGDLFITLRWRGFPFAKLFRKWYCLTVEKQDVSDYLLVQYHDFTRVYQPGIWERVFTGENHNG